MIDDEELAWEYEDICEKFSRQAVEKMEKMTEDWWSAPSLAVINSLTIAERVAYVIDRLWGDVVNGGFQQYYHNGNGYKFDITYEALLLLGEKKLARILRKANALYESSYRDILEHTEGYQPIELFEKCDDAFSQNEGEYLLEKCGEYIATNCQDVLSGLSKE